MSSPRLLSLQAFTIQLEAEIKRAQRYGRALSVALIALDALGELGGRAVSGAREAVLGSVGRAIAGGVRGSDLACPTGAGEFAVPFAEDRRRTGGQGHPARDRRARRRRRGRGSEARPGGGGRRARAPRGPRRAARPRPFHAHLDAFR